MEQFKDVILKIGDDLLTKALDPALWEKILLNILWILLVVIVAQIVVQVGKRLINRAMKINARTPIQISERRNVTIRKLLENIWGYVVYFIAIMMILDYFSIPVRSILAGAGIVGVAVGFGAQSLVKDIITGFFIIFEDQFAVGDFIRVNSSGPNQGIFEGTVEELGLRTSKIRSITGEIHIIPNGNITDVTNFSVHNNFAIVDVGIAYEGDIGRAENVLQNLMQEMPEKYEELVGTPKLLGVQNLGPSEVTLRISAETQPMQHFAMMRALRKEIKLRLDEEGIEIPFPRMVMYNRAETSK